MKYILILWMAIGSGTAITTTTFDDKTACENAGKQFTKGSIFHGREYMCTPASSKINPAI
jgi:hypothetical protein